MATQPKKENLASKVSATGKKFIAKCKPKDNVVKVLRFSGIIGEGSTFKQGLNLEAVEDNIKKAFEGKNIKAVAVVVNSPGGSPVQSELIYNLIRKNSEEKKIPVYSFAEDVAASGGYWLLCAGDEAYAMNSSIVGSIGVIASSFGFTEAMKKIGVERRIYTQGENKALLDPFSPTREKDIDILTSAQKDVHDAFKDLVKERRKGKINPRSKTIFSGEFYSGKKAKELGLVDDIGDVHNVMREKFGDNVNFVKIGQSKSWIKKKLPFAGRASIAQEFAQILKEQIWYWRAGL